MELNQPQVFTNLLEVVITLMTCGLTSKTRPYSPHSGRATCVSAKTETT